MALTSNKQGVKEVKSVGEKVKREKIGFLRGFKKSLSLKRKDSKDQNLPGTKGWSG